MHLRLRSLLVASLVALIVTTGQAPAAAEAPADEQGPQRGRGAPGTVGDGGRGGPAVPPLTQANFSCSTGF